MIQWFVESDKRMMAGEYSAVTHVIMDMDGVLLGNEMFH